YDVIVTDLNMPGMNGLQFCERVVANRPDIPVVVMTAYASLETAISAFRVGAADYVTKPVQVDALALRLHRVVETRRLGAEVKRLREQVARHERFTDLVGSSPAMDRVHDLLSRVLESDASVLITGESGTGKEVVARVLHRRGHRRSGSFVAINCSAMPPHLMESELFGHEKGAFTDARSARPGLFAQANGGTLFLDEIGEMPLELQPKLLRVLQERTIRPVGGNKEIPVDVRIVAATNRDLESAVADKSFREDLYFRVNVINIELPPLRARGRDILHLAQHFLKNVADSARKQVTGLSPQAAEKLLAYSWPGNVRELRNCIERAVALAQYEHITVDDLPEKIRDYTRSHVIVTSDDPSELVPMEEVERRYITRVLEAVNGNKTMAAKILRFDRKTLYRKLSRYNIEVQVAETTADPS
ncbi:MAG: sigma-54 dependent transcriptional regulator, partial [Myxococcota bacterium]